MRLIKAVGLAVHALDDGSVRIQTISYSADARTEFSYDFGDDVELRPEPEEVAIVDAPWAVDADGVAVETHYEIEDGELVQVVEPDAETTFPVVADPRVSIGWGVYVKFNKSESKSIANSWIADKDKYISIVCAVIPNPFAAAACAVISYDTAASVHSSFKQARDQGRCTELRYVVVNPSHWVLVGWKPVAC